MTPATNKPEPTAIDWARLAAYIDGEGNIRIRSRIEKSGAVRTYLEVSVSNSDTRLIMWIGKVFGGGHFTADRRTKYAHQKPNFRWCSVSRRAAEIIAGCLDYFVIKRDQADIAVAFASTVKRVGGKRHSREILEYRIALQEQLQNMHGWSGERHGRSRAITILAAHAKTLPVFNEKKGESASIQ